jgi:hypothetical protein
LQPDIVVFVAKIFGENAAKTSSEVSKIALDHYLSLMAATFQLQSKVQKPKMFFFLQKQHEPKAPILADHAARASLIFKY